MNPMHAPADASPPPAPLHRRVVETFVAPAPLFRRFRASAPWVDALVLVLGLSVIVLYLLPADIWVRQAEEAALRGEVELTSPPETIARYGRILAAMGVVMAQGITILLVAGILLLVFTVLLRGTARYQQYLAITAHAFLISAFGTLLTVPLQYLTGDPDARLSPALFLSPADAWLRAFLQTLDLFTLWTLVVVALGASIVNRRPGWGASTAILLAGYLAFTAGVSMALT